MSRAECSLPQLLGAGVLHILESMVIVRDEPQLRREQATSSHRSDAREQNCDRRVREVSELNDFVRNADKWLVLQEGRVCLPPHNSSDSSWKQHISNFAVLR